MEAGKRCQLLVEAIDRYVKFRFRSSDTDEARVLACDELYRAAVGPESIFHSTLKEYPGITVSTWLQCDNEACKKPIKLHDALRSWPRMVQCLNCKSRRRPDDLLPQTDFFDRPSQESHRTAYVGQALGHSEPPVERDTAPFLLLMTEHDPVRCNMINSCSSMQRVQFLGTHKPLGR